MEFIPKNCLMLPVSLMIVILSVVGSILFVFLYDSTTYDEVLEVKKQLANDNYHLQRSLEKQMNQYYMGDIDDKTYLEALYEIQSQVDEHILEIKEKIDNPNENLTFHDANNLQVRISGEITMAELNLLQ